LTKPSKKYLSYAPTHSRNVKEKSKQSSYRLGEALRVTEDSGSQLLKQ
jgi:hypothetical protein